MVVRLDKVATVSRNIILGEIGEIDIRRQTLSGT